MTLIVLRSPASSRALSGYALAEKQPDFDLDTYKYNIFYGLASLSVMALLF